MRSEFKAHKRPIFWVILSIIITIFCLIVAIFWSTRTAAPVTPDFSINIPKIEKVSSNTLFFGNIYWGRYINDWSMASELKYAYPFSRLNEFNRENYDAWISTLECPSVYGVEMTSYEEDSTLTFNCSPDYLPEAAKWFDILSLANNHTDNQGLDGFEETKTNLENNNIQYFGSYSTENIDDTCEVIALSVSVSYGGESAVRRKLPVALCGYQGIFRIPTTESIDEITKYSQYLPTIAMPHMGAEYVATPDEIKINTYRAMIDAGADMVIGDHPHTIQTSEVYNGRPIIYSMGNFIFDQQNSLETTRSAGINVLMTIENQDPLNLEKWLRIGESCTDFKDDCLQKIIDNDLDKLDVSYKIGIIGTRDNNKIARPATEEELSSILDRLNWSETLRDLQPPYSGL